MSDRAALLAAILQFPAEDAPRLIFADWLDEHGGHADDVALARFIRYQCGVCDLKPFEAGALARKVLRAPSRVRPFDLTGRVTANCSKRTATIYGDNVGVPAWEFEDWYRTNGGGMTPCARYARGFIEYVRLPSRKWFRDSDYFLTLHPIRSVSLTTVPTPDELLSIAKTPTTDPKELHIPELLAGEWPGIEFETPGVPFEAMSWYMALARTRAGTNAGGGK